jgi:hypothetical protein
MSKKNQKAIAQTSAKVVKVSKKEKTLNAILERIALENGVSLEEAKVIKESLDQKATLAAKTRIASLSPKGKKEAKVKAQALLQKVELSIIAQKAVMADSIFDYYSILSEDFLVFACRGLKASGQDRNVLVCKDTLDSISVDVVKVLDVCYKNPEFSEQILKTPKQKNVLNIQLIKNKLVKAGLMQD